MLNWFFIILKSSLAALLFSCALIAPAQAQYNDLLLGAGLSKGETLVSPTISTFDPGNPYWFVELLHGFSAESKVGIRYGVRFFRINGSESSVDYVLIGEQRFENRARFKHFYIGLPLHAQFGGTKMALFFGPELNIRLSTHRSRDIPAEPDILLPDLPSDRKSTVYLMAAVGLRKGLKIGGRSYFIQLRYCNEVSIDGVASEFDNTLGLSVGTRFNL